MRACNFRQTAISAAFPRHVRADCHLPPATCRPPTAGRHLPPADRRLPTADCRPSADASALRHSTFFGPFRNSLQRPAERQILALKKFRRALKISEQSRARRLTSPPFIWRTRRSFMAPIYNNAQSAKKNSGAQNAPKLVCPENIFRKQRPMCPDGTAHKGESRRRGQ